jgi:hypothetical protein
MMSMLRQRKLVAIDAYSQIHAPWPPAAAGVDPDLIMSGSAGEIAAGVVDTVPRP